MAERTYPPLSALIQQSPQQQPEKTGMPRSVLIELARYIQSLQAPTPLMQEGPIQTIGIRG